MFDINTLIRPAIKGIKSYHVWRDVFLDKENILFLDNCENNYGSPLGKGQERYPSSSQATLKTKLAAFKMLHPKQLVFGNGSDELIDLLMRAFCEPSKDSILISEPTFGMFKIYAQLNNIAVINVPLLQQTFLYDLSAIQNAITPLTKLIFICSPNNPTGSSLPLNELIQLTKNTKGIVVVDEAYIDFSSHPSALTLVNELPNLVVLQTFSKAWGLAGLRLGVAYAQEAIIEVLNTIRPPFNISLFTQQQLSLALDKAEVRLGFIESILSDRKKLSVLLPSFSFVKRVLPSDANFLMVEVNDAERLCAYLQEHSILISNRSALLHCTNFVRIGIGTTAENLRLLNVLAQLDSSLHVI